MLRRPDEDAINRFIASQQNSSLTYATKYMTRSGNLPAGFNCDHLRLELGTGKDIFERAVAALQNWTMFQQGWVKLFSDGPPRIGQVVAIVPQIGPTWWLNACRVLYLIEEQTPTHRVGFGYGTLQDHAERGEERFLIEMTPDGRVWYELFAYSQPRHWLARLGGPITPLQQKRFAKGSAAAMLRAINEI
jgi:uncharacterized protein (UPF0548 family)